MKVKIILFSMISSFIFSSSFASDFFKMLDTNEDGKLSKAEAAGGKYSYKDGESTYTQKVMSPEEEEKFRLIDINGDGYLTEEEFIQSKKK